MTRETDQKKLQEYCSRNPNGLPPEKLVRIREEMEHPRENTISDEYLDFTLWCRGLPSRKESFAGYILKEIRDIKGMRILEVGGGRDGRLSMLLAEKGCHMTCMDPELDLGRVAAPTSDHASDFSGTKPGSDQETRPSDFKVILRKELFDYRDTDLSDYDYVIAQEPCEATEHIIRACTVCRVPFMILLCGTPHRLISGEMPEDVWTWYLYLREIDPGHTAMEVVDLYGLVKTVMIRSNCI